jgi:hypothetical protein
LAIEGRDTISVESLKRMAGLAMQEFMNGGESKDCAAELVADAPPKTRFRLAGNKLPVATTVAAWRTSISDMLTPLMAPIFFDLVSQLAKDVAATPIEEPIAFCAL